jgi:hypothetical protein
LDTALAIVQVASGIALGAMTFFPKLNKPGGGLTRRGWVVFGIAAASLVGSTVWIHVRSVRSARVADQRIDQLMQTMAQCVMTPSKGPAQPLPASTGPALHILEPPNGASVGPTADVRGQVSDSRAQVWVLVHPSDTSSYWVQRKVSVRDNGEWQVTCYFGRSGADDVGKRFEVLAVADPPSDLREGAILDQWPSARLVSDVVSVQRK